MFQISYSTYGMAFISSASTLLIGLDLRLSSASLARATVFHTPSAVSVLFDLVRAINRSLETGTVSDAHALAGQLERLGGKLGLLYQDPAAMLGIGGVSDAEADGDADAAIETLIEKRRQARHDKDFQLSDKVRGQLEEMGIILEDRPDGSTLWRRR